MQSAPKHNAVKWITGAIFLMLVACSLGSNIIGVTMNPLIGEFSLTGASQGLMNSMINLGSTLPLVIIPFLQGRIHKSWLIILGSALQALMLLLTGLSGNFTLLLVACALLGAGNNFTDSCCNSYIVDLHPADNSKYLNLLHGFFGVGGLITPLLITWILNNSGWRASYSVAAVICAVIIVLFAAIVLRHKKDVTGASASSEKPITGEMFRGYITNRRNLMLMIGTIFYAASQLGLINWIVRYMSVRFDAPDLGSIGMSAYWICATICRMFCSKLPYAPHKMLVVGCIGAGVFHAIGVISGSPIVMIICSGLVGIVSGLCIPVLVSEAAIGNEDRTALSTSSLFLLMGLSRMLMPLLMGAVAASSIVSCMLLPAASALIGAVFCALANRDRPVK